MPTFQTPGIKRILPVDFAPSFASLLKMVSPRVSILPTVVWLCWLLVRCYTCKWNFANDTHSTMGECGKLGRRVFQVIFPTRTYLVAHIRVNQVVRKRDLYSNFLNLVQNRMITDRLHYQNLSIVSAVFRKLHPLLSPRTICLLLAWALQIMHAQFGCARRLLSGVVDVIIDMGDAIRAHSRIT